MFWATPEARLRFPKAKKGLSLHSQLSTQGPFSGEKRANLHPLASGRTSHVQLHRKEIIAAAKTTAKPFASSGHLFSTLQQT